MREDVSATVEAVWRMEAAKVVAVVARSVGDVGVAEDAAQDALVDALESWPDAGVPDAPGAWLTTVARRRAVDRLRREASRERAEDRLTRPEEARAAGDAESLFGDVEYDVTDEVLRLIFTACHPVLSRTSRVALTLRMVAGMTTAEVARALMTSETAVGQRISRAKRRLREDGVDFEVPSGEEMRTRLTTVLEVLHLIFNEGYVATTGGDWARGELMTDALRLARVLAGLTPGEPEVHGLLALMKIQASRTRARVGPDGTPVPLLEQDRTRWDWLLIRNGLASLARATALRSDPGPYVLQAEIAACHARAVRPELTDWVRITLLYAELSHQTPSPVVELNRAVALSYAVGPEAALPVVDAVADDPSMERYHLLPSVRGDILARMGRGEEAATEFERAARMTGNEAERAHLLRRADEALRT